MGRPSSTCCSGSFTPTRRTPQKPPAFYLAGFAIDHTTEFVPASSGLAHRSLQDFAKQFALDGGEARFLALQFLQLDPDFVETVENGALITALILAIAGGLLTFAQDLKSWDQVSFWGHTQALAVALFFGAGKITDLLDTMEPNKAAMDALAALPGVLATLDPYPAECGDNPICQAANEIIALAHEGQHRFNVFHQKIAVVRNDAGRPRLLRRDRPQRQPARRPRSRRAAAPITTCMPGWTGSRPASWRGPSSSAGTGPPRPATRLARAAAPGARGGRRAGRAAHGRARHRPGRADLLRAGPARQRPPLPLRPGRRAHHPRHDVCRRSSQARRYIYIEDQYLTPPLEYAAALEAAANQVSGPLIILIPSVPDQPFGFAPRQAFVNRMSEAWGDRLKVGSLRQHFYRVADQPHQGRRPDVADRRRRRGRQHDQGRSARPPAGRAVLGHRRDRGDVRPRQGAGIRAPRPRSNCASTGGTPPTCSTRPRAPSAPTHKKGAAVCGGVYPGDLRPRQDDADRRRVRRDRLGEPQPARLFLRRRVQPLRHPRRGEPTATTGSATCARSSGPSPGRAARNTRTAALRRSGRRPGAVRPQVHHRQPVHPLQGPAVPRRTSTSRPPSPARPRRSAASASSPSVGTGAARSRGRGPRSTPSSTRSSTRRSNGGAMKFTDLLSQLRVELARGAGQHLLAADRRPSTGCSPRSTDAIELHDVVADIGAGRNGHPHRDAQGRHRLGRRRDTQLVSRLFPSMRFVFRPDPRLVQRLPLSRWPATATVTVQIDTLPLDVLVPPDLLGAHPTRPSAGRDTKIELSDCADPTVITRDFALILEAAGDLRLEPHFPISIGPCRLMGVPMRAVHEMRADRLARDARNKLYDWVRPRPRPGPVLLRLRRARLRRHRVRLRDRRRQPAPRSARPAHIRAGRRAGASRTWSSRRCCFPPLPQHGTIGLRRSLAPGESLEHNLSFDDAPIQFPLGQFGDAVLRPALFPHAAAQARR